MGTAMVVALRHRARQVAFWRAVQRGGGSADFSYQNRCLGDDLDAKFLIGVRYVLPERASS